MNEILKKLSQELLSGTVVAEILGNPTNFPFELIEKLSVETATQYWNGKIDFEDGDCIMNNLQSFWVTNENNFQNSEFGETSWSCYLAFDQGEYHRPNESMDIDPAEKYTKPLIEKLLKEIKVIE